MVEKIGHDQLYELLTGEEISWQAILYDLINSEQLDPWDIDLGLLANRYLEKIKQLEEANFFLSSKVLLAASILLRMKSEILRDRHLRGIDEILFGKKEEKKQVFEKIEIDEDQLPILYPKTPLPRKKRVSLQELMQALDHAMSTETRRIRREIRDKQALKMTEMVFPRSRMHIKERIRRIYAKILTLFGKRQERVSYTELIGKEREERIASFLPLLHLDAQQKVWLEQNKYFDEIWIWLYKAYAKKMRDENRDKENEGGIEKELKQVRRDVEKRRERVEKVNDAFENPLGDFFEIFSERKL